MRNDGSVRLPLEGLNQLYVVKPPVTASPDLRLLFKENMIEILNTYTPTHHSLRSCVCFATFVPVLVDIVYEHISCVTHLIT